MTHEHPTALDALIHPSCLAASKAGASWSSATSRTAGSPAPTRRAAGHPGRRGGWWRQSHCYGRGDWLAGHRLTTSMPSARRRDAGIDAAVQAERRNRRALPRPYGSTSTAMGQLSGARRCFPATPWCCTRDGGMEITSSVADLSQSDAANRLLMSPCVDGGAVPCWWDAGMPVKRVRRERVDSGVRSYGEGKAGRYCR